MNYLVQQNGQTHSNNSSATADELFESVWPFSEWNENYPIGSYIYKFKNKNIRLIQA